MYSFRNDYSEGAHMNILNALLENNFDQQTGYGNDFYSQKAKEFIKGRLKDDSVDIHFVSGGTQANLLIISSILKPYESVICADTGHINVHETGAIEATGHKIHSIATTDGKLTVDHIQSILNEHQDEHMVKPRLVFISNATELGTIYKKNELKEISDFCQKNKLYLHLDGARLGSGLTSRENDLDIAQLAELVDVFYIGGTKNGALLGEAIVIKNNNLKENFRYHMKQRGAMLAKGRVISIQFMELFKDDLFFKLAKHSNDMAYKISDELKKMECEFLVQPVTNQLFPIFSNEIIELLQKEYEFNIERRINKEKAAIRLVTSWNTKEEDVDDFLRYIKNIL